MKKNKIYQLAMSAAVAMAGLTGLTACQAQMDEPEQMVPAATISANTTILELKKAFENQTVEVGTKENGEHYIIHGRVISSDASGNIYKSLVIQDETAALTFSINQGSMYTDYRLGQEMVVDMTGLYIGYYRGLQQVGAPGSPYDGAPQLGFMAYDYWMQHAQKNGLPQPETVNVMAYNNWPSESMYCIIERLPISTANLLPYQSQLVELRDVHFVDADGELIYAPYQESVTRYIANDNGDQLAVRNSGYSNFWNQPLPKGKGTVRGILSYYGDSWQLVLRDLNDVMIDNKGTSENPLTVAEAMQPDNRLRQVWTAGYIVGSVKAGVDEVTGNQDIIFGKNAEMDNNVVIADSPDCTDWKECMLVPLPLRTLLRTYANLADNPDVYKKKLSVYGEIDYDMGMSAMMDCPGEIGTFAIEGMEITAPKDFEEIYHALEPSATSCDFTFDNVEMASGLTRVWSWKDYNGKSYLNGSAYAGGIKAAKSYAISPVIDLKGKTEAKASFRHAAKFQTTLRNLCGFAVREEGSTSWTEFTIPTWPTAGSWTFADSGDIDISVFAGKKIQIAFKYGSDASGADTWEINDLSVMAK